MQKIRVRIFSEMDTNVLERKINDWFASRETSYNQIFIQSTNQSSTYSGADCEHITISIYYYLVKNK